MTKIAKMTEKVQIVKNFLPFIAILIPSIILYLLDPLSFEETLKGQNLLSFLFVGNFLETILKVEGVAETKIKGIRSLRSVIFIITFLMPTLYVLTENYFGLNTTIDELAIKNNIDFATKFPGSFLFH